MEVEEIKLFDEPHAWGRVGPVDARMHAHMVGQGLEYHRRLVRIRAAPPQPDGSRITGSGDHSLAIGARQQQRIGIEPLGAALCFRQNEAVRDKGLCVDIEFAQRGGVAAAARQA